MATTQVLFSVNPDYYAVTAAELRRTWRVRGITQAGPDAGLVTLPAGVGLADVAAACSDGRVRFVRHLAEVVAETPTASLTRETPEGLAAAVHEVASSTGTPMPAAVSVHVWESGESVPFSPTAVRRPVVAALEAEDVAVLPSGCDETVSVCLGERHTVICRNETRLGLSDWPGGRLRLAQRAGQVSRAEFKLEELFTHVDLGLGETRHVGLDLGAAPGGWTRVLLTAGMREVHAVDPGELDERVRRLPGARHHRTTAGEYLRGEHPRFDVVVNDMRMDPMRSVDVMLDVAPHLARGGVMVQTLKLRPRDALETTDKALRRLDERYEVFFARQLQHNRNEVTVVAQVRPR